MTGTSEAVSAAKALEIEGRDFYVEAARRARSPAVGKMFRALADDESRHLEWLEALSTDGKQAGRLNRALFGRLKRVFAGVSPSELADKLRDDIAAIDFAIGIEEKSVRAYSDWVEKGDSDELRRLGETLVGQERFHRQLLENAKEYLERPGDWFMQEERWNFEGG